jgi:hypothetical protein
LIEFLNLKADIDRETFDGSNALLCAAANRASPEVIQYLVDHGSNINQQIDSKPHGFANQIARCAGFTSLHMAVNNKDYDSVKILLTAGADPEIYTGLSVAKRFPIPINNNYLELYENFNEGHCLTPLHIAACMDSNELILKLLIDKGNANVHARVNPVCSLEWCMSSNAKYQKWTLNSPLHLCATQENSSKCALILLDSGASLLAQNLALTAAWQCHKPLLVQWLRHSQILNLEDTVVAVCNAKNLPMDCALYITEFYVSLHVTDHFVCAYEQETSDNDYWPWMALGLIHHHDCQMGLTQPEDSFVAKESTLWDIHGDDIVSAFEMDRCEIEGETQKFVCQELMKLKTQQAKELFEVLSTELYQLGLFENAQDMHAVDNENRTKAKLL